MRAEMGLLVALCSMVLSACSGQTDEPSAQPAAEEAVQTSSSQSAPRVANPQTAVVTDERGADWTIPIDLSGVDTGGYEPFMALRFRCRTFDNLADFKMVAEGWEFETSIRVRSGNQEIVLRRDLDGYFSQSYGFNLRHPEGSEVARDWPNLTGIIGEINRTRRITINEQIEVKLEDPRGYLSSTATACERIGQQTQGRQSAPTRLALRRIDDTNFEEALAEIGGHEGRAIALNVRIPGDAGDEFTYRSGDLEVRMGNLVLRTSKNLTRIGSEWGLEGRFMVSRERQGPLTIISLNPL